MASRQQALMMIMIVALALATSTMTALRVPGVPVGLAEILLLGCMVVHLPLGFGLHGGNSPNRFVPFLLLLVVAMLPGYFGTLIRNGQIPFALYNLVASFWVVLLFAYIHYGFDHGRGEIELLGRFFLMFSSVYFAVVLALSVFEPAMVYRQDDIESLRLDAASGAVEGAVFRLAGFATNPNQLALHALVCVFFSLELRKRVGTMMALVCLGLALACGLLAKSDAFLFSAIALIGTWMTMSIVFNGAVILGLMLIVPAVAGLIVMLRPIVQTIQSVAGTNSQDVTRFTLWENGVRAALERPLIGYGPGAWSGFDGPLGFEEAHNSAIDYFSNAGLIGATLLLVGVVAILWRTFVTKQAAMFAGTVAILLFAAFHNVLRQPVMWLGFYYIAQRVWAGTGRAPENARQRGRRRSRRPIERSVPV